MCVEQVIIQTFRDTLNTKLPIQIIEDKNDIIVVVGERVYVNVEIPSFLFVSDVDIVKV